MGKNNTVLVVDDEAHIRRVMEIKLKNAGYEVLTASNGEDALEIIKGQKPRAVITDIMMPKLDGKALCQMTDGLKEKRPFLTVVTTCRILPQEKAWIENLRDTVFIEKPFSPAKILECIDEYFAT